MIILDTNVISELMREKPEFSVFRWVGEQELTTLAITTITVAEIMRGIARLPAGKRRRKLQQNFDVFIHEAFWGRILSFDKESAFLYGDLSTIREKAGFGIDAVDMMIAAIAKRHNAGIATRNVRDFEGCGIGVVNPWRQS
jgi:predicted nucleic acid-binding protein